ncbi:DNA-binding transcriptional regulator, AcrR family [Parafrankia irregularis]|uniref:DNA-binding transcriptional regulator, AcrR family n=1 Tax=Parafrankia irregularis TaxID=795642 RepID=A0A0S4QUV4_9ACTN|nr:MULTISPECIES: TetR/AcrR family transcriptional regulator [Parafrankia]MBE3201547.1 TetR/AcrR family transcriptional regulator [Parafrankia sp. CH37]CUU59383.1 DNA-binding transcriptional regulator, AcrR family [Parafrankia irregularis]
MRDPLTPNQVIAAARSLLERDGYQQFSMRRLAAELGVAPTAIYWHVGNRDELLDTVLGQMGDTIGAVGVVGASPAERIVSAATSLLGNINEHRGLVELAHQRGILLALMGPARLALAGEFAQAGLRGAQVADATNAVVQLVGDHVTVGHVARDWPEQAVGDVVADAIVPSLDPTVAAALGRPPARGHTFAVMLNALVDGLLRQPAAESAQSAHASARTSAPEGPARTATRASSAPSNP